MLNIDHRNVDDLVVFVSFLIDIKDKKDILILTAISVSTCRVWILIVVYRQTSNILRSLGVLY